MQVCPGGFSLCAILAEDTLFLRALSNDLKKIIALISYGIMGSIFQKERQHESCSYYPKLTSVCFIV